jgi:D-xylonolactonase
MVFKEVGLPNGMGFTPDQRQLYHTDTPRRHIYRSDYNRETGALTNTQTFVVVPEDVGNPDGMTVDRDGNVWAAIFGGSCLVHFASDGSEQQRIQLPANNVTSVAFAGDDYSDMYVTTAGGEDKTSNGEGAGALFRFRLGVRGVPEFRSRVAL